MVRVLIETVVIIIRDRHKVMAKINLMAMEQVLDMVTVVGTKVVMVIAAVMVEAILNLIIPIRINPPEQKVGKIEVMEILQKTLNMKVAEAEEKEVFLMRVMSQMRKISIPFP